MNIVIPMAGAGSRFANEGYTDPKPLIPINGVPMIKVVIDNLRPPGAHRFIFICQRAHVTAYDLRPKLSAWAPGCVVVEIDGLTEGAACTVLAAKDLIDNATPLMIANSDQYVDTEMQAYLAALDTGRFDGLIMTMQASDPKWSYVGLDDARLVTRVVEKQVISDEATVGIYNFRHGRGFVRAAESMIAKNERVNNEFYVAPTYNQLIAEGQRIGIFNVGSVEAGMYGLGTPEDLKSFLTFPGVASDRGGVSMIVISHRGHWLTPDEKNQESAFRRSFDGGFGTETDVRDALGTLVISHDMPAGGEMALRDFLRLPGAANLPMAINIKADGLAPRLREMAAEHELRDWFVFDMSVPDMRPHFEAGNPVFTRMSEVERSPAWLEESAGVWLDGFESDWYDAALVSRLLDAGKRVCVVSPELHRRPAQPVWDLLFPLRMSDRLILCTDFPDHARRFFEGPE